MIEPGGAFSHKTMDAFGYRIAYAEAGDGPVIVSLPGSVGLEMSRAKDMLAREYRVIEIEPPGWGASPELAGDMRQSELALILAAAVNRLGIESFTLIGVTLGAINAMWLAQRMPERVTALVLEAPMLFCRDQDMVRPDTGKAVAAIRAGLQYDETAQPTPPADPHKPWETAEHFHENMRRRFKMTRHFDFPGESGELEPFARRMTIPVTMLLGAADQMLKPSIADHLKTIMPHMRARLIEGAKHDIQNTAPEEFVDAVRRAGQAV